MRQWLLTAALLLAVGGVLPAWADDVQYCSLANAPLNEEQFKKIADGLAATCRRMAEDGDAMAEYILAFLYDVGQGVPHSDAEAVRWLRMAADQGYADTENFLAERYRVGHGVPQNFVQSYMWFEVAHRHGNPGAAMGIKMIADKMTLSQIDQAQALAAVWKPTWAGDAENCRNAATLVQTEPVGVVAACRRLAKNGVATAQNQLGLLYANGLGMPQDYAEAARWYREAAERGSAGGQKGLSFLYFAGQGVPQDYVHAYMWADLAAAQGAADHAMGLHMVAAKMTSAQIEHAKAFAAAWKPATGP